MNTLQTAYISVNNQNMPQNPTSTPQSREILSSLQLDLQESIGDQISLNITETATTEQPQTQTSLVIRAKLYLIRRLSFFLFAALLSILILLFLQKRTSSRSIFVLIYCYLAFLFVESAIISRKSLVVGWKATECKLDMLLMVSKAISMALIDLTSAGHLSSNFYGLLPFLFGILIHFFVSKMPDPDKTELDLTRLVILVQVNLIQREVDRNSVMDWRNVLAPSLVFFGITVIYFMKYVIPLSKDLKTIMSEPNFNNRTQLRRDIIGNIWSVMNGVMYCIGFTTLVGVVQAYSLEKDTRLLEICAKICFVVFSLMFAFTVISFESLKNFVEQSTLIISETPTVEASSEQTPQKMKSKVEFHVEEMENYFVKMSPTYYQPLITQNLKEIKEANKEVKYDASIHIPDGCTGVETHNIENQETEAALSTEENACYICYTDTSDVIFGGCGHGGVCFKCAKISLEQKSQCMECRNTVSILYRFRLHKISTRLVEGYEMVKLTYL